MRKLLALFCLPMLAVPSAAQKRAGTIIFYRPSHFTGATFKPELICDGVSLARITNGTFFQISAAEGSHSCTTESPKRPAIQISVAAGQTYYVLVELENGFKQHALLANTDADAYAKEQSRLNAISEWSRNALDAQQPSAGTTMRESESQDTTTKPSVFIEASETVTTSSVLFGSSTTKTSRYSSIVSEWSKSCPNVSITNSKDDADYDAQFPGDGVILFDKSKTLILAKKANINPEAKGIQAACSEILKRETK
jgi:hypothetical protein